MPGVWGDAGRRLWGSARAAFSPVVLVAVAADHVTSADPSTMAPARIQTQTLPNAASDDASARRRHSAVEPVLADPARAELDPPDPDSESSASMDAAPAAAMAAAATAAEGGYLRRRRTLPARDASPPLVVAEPAARCPVTGRRRARPDRRGAGDVGDDLISLAARPRARLCLGRRVRAHRLRDAHAVVAGRDRGERRRGPVQHLGPRRPGPCPGPALGPGRAPCRSSAEPDPGRDPAPDWPASCWASSASGSPGRTSSVRSARGSAYSSSPPAPSC